MSSSSSSSNGSRRSSPSSVSGSSSSSRSSPASKSSSSSRSSPASKSSSSSRSSPSSGSSISSLSSSRSRPETPTPDALEEYDDILHSLEEQYVLDEELVDRALALIRHDRIDPSYSTEEGTTLLSSIMDYSAYSYLTPLLKLYKPYERNYLMYRDKTLMEYAIDEKSLDLSKRLINAKIDVDGYVAEDGQNYFEMAVKKNYLPIVKLIYDVSSGDVLETEDADGKTPIEYALYPITYFLYKSGADLDHGNADLDQMLEDFAENDKPMPELIELIEMGADPMILLDAGIRKKNDAYKEIAIERGARIPEPLVRKPFTCSVRKLMCDNEDDKAEIERFMKLETEQKEFFSFSVLYPCIKNKMYIVSSYIDAESGIEILCGALGVKYAKKNGLKTYYVSHFATQSLRNPFVKNAGRQLMEALIEDARSRNIDYIYLSAWPTAVGFYKKFGFDEIENGENGYLYLILNRPPK